MSLFPSSSQFAAGSALSFDFSSVGSGFPSSQIFGRATTSAPFPSSASIAPTPEQNRVEMQKINPLSGMTAPDYERVRNYPLTDDVQEAEAARARVMESLPNVRHVTSSINLLTAEQIHNLSNGIIIFKEGTVGEGTVGDPRLGSSYKESSCSQCRVFDCPGHYGCINMNRPIYNPRFLKNGTILKVLKCICMRCSRLLLRDQAAKIESGQKGRLATICQKTIDMHSVCTYSDCKPYRVTYEALRKDSKSIKYKIERTKNQEADASGSDAFRILFASDALNIFNRITPETARILGFKNKNTIVAMIMQRMLVPPAGTRASVVINGTSKVNDITEFLNKIVIANNNMEPMDGMTSIVMSQVSSSAKGKKAKAKTASDSTSTNLDRLYQAVTIYQEFIISLIKDKDALIRSMMLGKRGDFCGRGVIGPDDDIRFGEVVVPEYMMRFLTPRIRVTADNIDEMEALMDKGRITQVIPREGSGRVSTAVSSGRTVMFEIGDDVERYLQDGDMLIVGRQPTIHKYNVMAYRVRIFGDRPSLGLMLAVTGALNADFDGDEVSVWMVMSPEAHREAKEKMFVCRNIISQSNNAPVIGLKMDTVTSIFKMTAPDVGVPMINESVMRVLMQDILASYVGLDDNFYDDDIDTVGVATATSMADLEERLKPFKVPLLSGRAIFSSLLPEGFTYSKGDVEIVNGVLIRGQVTSADMSTSHRGIIQDLYHLYGWKVTSNFITNSTRAARRFADLRGISIGYTDCDFGTSKYATALLQEAKIKAETDVQALGRKRGTAADEILRQQKIMAIANDFSGAASKIADLTMDEENTLRDMGKGLRGGGAKGGAGNTSAMGVSVGNKTEEGERIRLSMDDKRRASIYTKPGDESLQARGMCENSYFSGFNPIEMFFDALSVRKSVSDTPLRVPEVGEAHRNISKALENVMVFENGSSSNLYSDVFQEIYGGDGFDASELLNIKKRDGDIQVSFIDLKMVAENINTSYGWIRETKSAREAIRT